MILCRCGQIDVARYELVQHTPCWNQWIRWLIHMLNDWQYFRPGANNYLIALLIMRSWASVQKTYARGIFHYIRIHRENFARHLSSQLFSSQLSCPTVPFSDFTVAQETELAHLWHDAILSLAWPRGCEEDRELFWHWSAGFIWITFRAIEVSKSRQVMMKRSWTSCIGCHVIQGMSVWVIVSQIADPFRSFIFHTAVLTKYMVSQFMRSELRFDLDLFPFPKTPCYLTVILHQYSTAYLYHRLHIN